jgi:hypothetical protein
MFCISRSSLHSAMDRNPPAPLVTTTAKFVPTGHPPRARKNATLRNELEELRGDYQDLQSIITYLKQAPHARALEALHQLRSSPSNWPADLDIQACQPDTNPSSLPPSSKCPANGLNSPPSEPDRATCTPTSDACEGTQDQLCAGEEPDFMAPAEPVQEECCEQRHYVQDRAARHASLSLVRRSPDPRLKALDISFWTVVPVTDTFAREAISSYLRSDHRVWWLFDTDVFISDLVRHKFDFCSQFLVNCLLAFASVWSSYPPSPAHSLHFFFLVFFLWPALYLAPPFILFFLGCLGGGGEN